MVVNRNHLTEDQVRRSDGLEGFVEGSCGCAGCSSSGRFDRGDDGNRWAFFLGWQVLEASHSLFIWSWRFPLFIESTREIEAMEDFLAVMLFIQSVALGLAAYQLRKLTEIFIELAERIDKWDEAMRARTWIFKQVKINEQQRGNA